VRKLLGDGARQGLDLNPLERDAGVEKTGESTARRVAQLASLAYESDDL